VKILTGIAVSLGLLLAPSTALAQVELPVGEAEGVRVVREHRAIVVVFTERAAKLYKRIAGKLVIVSCTELLEDGGSSGAVTLRAPKQRGKLHTGDLTRGMDFCRVWLAPRTAKVHGKRRHFGRELLVSVPLTQKGAVFLDEESKAGDIFSVLLLADIVAKRQKLDDLYPTHAQIVAEFPRVARVLVALAAPTDAPPAGKAGYYSDGQKHVAVATLSASGRRLFIEFDDDVLSTNVAGYLFGGID
jgi:hypothetical protein